MAIPQNNLRTPTEVSGLVSPRDSISPTHNWKSTAQAARRAAALTDQASIVANKLAKTKITYDVDYDFHPWKVYVFPFTYREMIQPDFDLSKNWRTVRVRGGLIKTREDRTGCFPGSLSGLEGYDKIGWSSSHFPSESNALLPYGYNSDPTFFAATDFEIPVDSFYFIWAELTAWSPQSLDGDREEYRIEIKSTDEAAWSASGFSTNPYIWPLAHVNTSTYAAQNVLPDATIQDFAIIRQLQFDHIDLDIPTKYYGIWQYPMSGYNDTWTVVPSRGYPRNAIVSHSNALWQSMIWFNTEEPGAGDEWMQMPTI